MGAPAAEQRFWNVYSKFFLICSNVTANCCCDVALISSIALTSSAFAAVEVA